ncbi:hypothetical protein M899_2466 [Bacteriovorax sp. BSW11_IV]|uniref:hypothetical protein n=1 Tax=Bacteriovorax sp. BSW11_IV TaxID=1353529 RepID=UPI000389F472|nr:hypothetical protein [Bacteriovorax sp. BSW11_IV]EQC44624.1 hypothetical protein M899_2466 [Bacteriovorax sp. BSW11_IV]
MNEEFLEKLNEIAFQKSEPFCYGCYVICPSGRCSKCGSDDLMRHLDGVGVEWGTDWIIKELLLDIDEVDQEESFDEYLESAYEQECSVAWLKVETLRILKELCECDYRIALNDWISSEEEDGEIVSFNNGVTYYKVSAVKEYIKENS